MKNPSHIRFGRIGRRQEEARHQFLVDELHKLDEHLGDAWEISPNFKQRCLRGADELELVRSGLNGTAATSINCEGKVFVVKVERYPAAFLGSK